MNTAALTLSTAILMLIAAAAISHGLLLLLRPLLLRYALALPNARSSHRTPTPQGAGIGVVAATVAISTLAALALDGIADRTLGIVLAAAVGIAIVGAVDDIKPVGVLPRLLLQAVAVAAILVAIPAEARIVPMLPLSLERVLLGLGAVWFVNLTNFMDGIDWITAAETVPVTAFIALFGVFGATSPTETVVALALCGAMLGFAPLNKPVAKMFLGDVGSLAIGLLIAWMLIALAGRGHLAAALLLPLYYLADATITLFLRLSRGEKVWVAHRTHFYQRATQNGFRVMETVTRIFAVNVALGLLALATLLETSLAVQISAVACGAALVAWLLYAFAKDRASAA
ncbi:MAG TPA: glycosyltransferase family 4 protein [Pseudolabrys sp.]|nr:glycosyltransferase family 4 protein [Pseudolabrys sp.]